MCYTAEVACPKPDYPSYRAVIYTAESLVTRMLLSGLATALADCSQVVPETQSPDHPIAKSLNVLPVYFSQHDVDGSDRRYDICQQPPFTHLRQRLEVREARGPHVYPIGFGRAVTDDVIAHFAARRFDRLINLTYRHCKAFRNNLEVIDEGFHLGLHLLAFGQHNPGCIRFRWAFGHPVERLPHDVDRLS